VDTETDFEQQLMARMAGVALLEACAEGDTDRVAEVLTATPGAAQYADELSDAKESPIHVASALGHVKILDALLQAGAKVDTVDAYGAMPLHYAAAEGRSEAVALLLDRGADIAARTNNGLLPIGAAHAANRVETRKLLRLVEEARKQGKRLNPGHSYREFLDVIRNSTPRSTGTPAAEVATDKTISPEMQFRDLGLPWEPGEYLAGFVKGVEGADRGPSTMYLFETNLRIIRLERRGLTSEAIDYAHYRDIRGVYTRKGFRHGEVGVTLTHGDRSLMISGVPNHEVERFARDLEKRLREQGR